MSIGMTMPLLPHHLELRLLSRVAEARAQEEAIELRFGEREGSLVLDRVLGGDQQERLGQLSRDTVDRDLTLAPSPRAARDWVFGVARLISSTRTMLREERARTEHERAVLLVEHREPGRVGGLEVGRALDA